VTCSICANWVYVEKDPDFVPNLDQARFEFWIYIELQLVWSFIFSGMFYLFWCNFKKPVVNLHSPLVKMESYGDYAETHSLFLDFACNFTAPALVALLQKSSPMVVMIGWISLIQTFLIYGALFLTRGSEERSKFYIKVMPEATYFAGNLAMSLLPVTIIGFNIYVAIMANSDGTNYIIPFCVFSILT
jgi:hypothetical protein